MSDLTEILKDYIDDLFAAADDGKITTDELKAATLDAVTALGLLVISDPSGVAGLVQKLGDKFRDEARLQRRIAEAETEGKTDKAEKLRRILDRIDG